MLYLCCLPENSRLLLMPLSEIVEDYEGLVQNVYYSLQDLQFHLDSVARSIVERCPVKMIGLCWRGVSSHSQWVDMPSRKARRA